MALPGQLVQHSLWSNSDFTRTLSIPQLLKAKHEPVKKLSERKLKMRGIKNKSNCLVPFSMLNPENGMSMSTFSPSDTIRKFYSCINKRDMNQLAPLMAEDCCYDDFSYAQPFQGRKETLKFLGQLTKCMGKKTEYCIEHIYEGVDLTIVVIWHLEWNAKQVPFSRGWSRYELSRDGEELVIRKAQVIVESPIKPGPLALEAFQKAISTCDSFPQATEYFFQVSPQLKTSYSRYTSWLNQMSTLSPWRDSKDQDQTPKND